MATHPADRWRARVSEEALELAAGTLVPDDAYAAKLFPESLITATDAALADFVRGLATVSTGPDEEVFDAVKRVVLTLNRINDDHGGAGYETQEREELCLYIEESLAEAGVDVDALAGRRGLTRHEITDEWREW